MLPREGGYSFARIGFAREPFLQDRAPLSHAANAYVKKGGFLMRAVVFCNMCFGYFQALLELSSVCIQCIMKSDNIIWIFGLVHHISYCTHQLGRLSHATYPWHDMPH